MYQYQPVYAFYHLTFAEYFASLINDDWDFFIPREHIDKPVKNKKYRIFNKRWKEVFLFWIGREDINAEEKDKALKKLCNFESDCYENHALLIAALGLNEYPKSPLSKTIFQQVLRLVFGYWDEQQTKWIDPYPSYNFWKKEFLSLINGIDPVKASHILLDFLIETLNLLYAYEDDEQDSKNNNVYNLIEKKFIDISSHITKIIKNEILKKKSFKDINLVEKVLEIHDLYYEPIDESFEPFNPPFDPNLDSTVKVGVYFNLLVIISNVSPKGNIKIFHTLFWPLLSFIAWVPFTMEQLVYEDYVTVNNYLFLLVILFKSFENYVSSDEEQIKFLTEIIEDKSNGILLRSLSIACINKLSEKFSDFEDEKQLLVKESKCFIDILQSETLNTETSQALVDIEENLKLLIHQCYNLNNYDTLQRAHELLKSNDILCDKPYHKYKQDSPCYKLGRFKNIYLKIIKFFCFSSLIPGQDVGIPDDYDDGPDAEALASINITNNFEKISQSPLSEDNKASLKRAIDSFVDFSKTGTIENLYTKNLFKDISLPSDNVKCIINDSYLHGLIECAKTNKCLEQEIYDSLHEILLSTEDIGLIENICYLLGKISTSEKHITSIDYVRSLLEKNNKPEITQELLEKKLSALKNESDFVDHIRRAARKSTINKQTNDLDNSSKNASEENNIEICEQDYIEAKRKAQENIEFRYHQIELVLIKSLINLGHGYDESLFKRLDLIVKTSNKHKGKAIGILCSLSLDNIEILDYLLKITDTEYRGPKVYILSQLLRHSNKNTSYNKRFVSLLNRKEMIDLEKNNSNRIYEKAYEILWNCSKNLAYPDFYHEYNSESNNTFSIEKQKKLLSNLPEYVKSKASHRIYWLDYSQLLDEPFLDYYGQLLDQDFPSLDAEPESFSGLRLRWDQIQRHKEKKDFLVLYSSQINQQNYKCDSKHLEHFSKLKGHVAAITTTDSRLQTFDPTDVNCIENLQKWIDRIQNEQ
ncbi:NACHT C-terminal alpha/beta 1 domain-containing protein [Synechococcus sp. BDU 130192]|uniref:NACHT C-terminal alpha/beta 1 domain-containing protein n=1 Tax=Synechococcus sp. BDU 130192 TaxID=2042059 RepID=UPI000C0892E3|nr:hypothetical protein [Synechococcus sp. BDU 130192]